MKPEETTGEAHEGATVHPDSWVNLDERTRKHIAFARTYADEFGHGAPGHLDLMTIAALSRIIDRLTGGA